MHEIDDIVSLIGIDLNFSIANVKKQAYFRIPAHLEKPWNKAGRNRD